MSLDTVTEGNGAYGALVENSGLFEIVGPQGGPFPQGTRTYHLSNNGEEVLVWDLDTVVPWLTATPPGGMLASGAATDVVVEINHALASQLAPGEYGSDLILRSRSNTQGSLYLAFQLTVEAPPAGELVIGPDTEVNVVTTLDADPSVANASLTITNGGDAPIDWEATPEAAWLTLNTPDGTTLDPGASATLELFVDELLLSDQGVGTFSTQVMVGPTGDHSQDQPVQINVTLSGSTDGRVRDGLIAEYRFDEGAGSVVHDISGSSPAMDLVIEDTQAVQWVPNGLMVQSPTRLATPGAATRLNQELMDSGEMTIEAWIRPSNLNQDGPARLVGISNGPSLRNFTLGQGLWGAQPKDTFNMRARTTSTDLDGMPILTTGAGAATGALQHVVYTRRLDGQARLFVDGQVASDTQLAGDLSNWDPSYPLVLANEFGASRPWLGEFYLVALYDRALTAAEVNQNRSVGSGAIVAGHLDVSPQSEIRITATIGSAATANAEGFDLVNMGGASLQWTASVNAPWISLGETAGQLDPDQAAFANLVLDENQLAAMPVGTYTATAHFENTTSGYGSTDKVVRLTVQAPGGSGGSGDGQRPGPTNTGPTNVSILQNVGGMTITQDGAVIENVRVSGTIVIEANNVTIRNFIVDAGYAPYAITATGGNYGIVLEDGELVNVNSAHIYGGGFSAFRLNLHESGGDGFKATNDVLVEGCWVHHLGTNDGAHADCNQTRWGSNFIFRGNFFDLPIDIGQPYKQNACFIMQTGDGPIDNILIENNWLTGGNFTVYVENKWNGSASSPNYGDPTNVRLLNNRFGREFRYGPLNITGTVLISGNRWDDNDQLMDINNN
ncbi:MAG: LamG domain-containing protein [Planctomycetes bacterium]|nr:LamG domain-containing protein [Planctomycetota bacterium]MCB9912173.1 LamG domain-containing protein [Planctomycetota bacterium]HPF13095.1 hypothetical protein [Planctomycetota bacterium]HRV80642.1 hypothetical protein [Planctomycetota bacterium]